MYINPYEDLNKSCGSWMKANFHVHAGTGYQTCGLYDLEEVVRLYKETGYDILCISNHDLFTDTSPLREKYDIGMMNGFEYSRLPHMLFIGGEDVILDAPHQEAVDKCRNQGGFVILCHPNWEHTWETSDMKDLKGYCGIEVLNGVISRLAGTGLAEDKWDELLSSGILAWGFGNDDFHRWMDLNNSYTCIYSRSNKREDVLDSIEKGCFYLSNGLALEEFDLSDNTLKISASEPGYSEGEYNYTFIGENSKILYSHTGKSAKFTLNGNEPYVRVKVAAPQGFILWTQPVYNPEKLKRP